MSNLIGQVTHRILRNPNVKSGPMFRIGNRSNPLKNTLTRLEDPANKRSLILIGTTNSSTYLSYRTKELIEKEKPDTVFLQTNKKWIENLKYVGDCKTQNEMNNFHAFLRSSYEFNEIPNHLRGLIFKFRLYTWLGAANFIKGFPKDFHPFIPGLEMKFALEAAQKQKSNVVLGGLALDKVTLEALSVEKRMDFIFLFWKYCFAAKSKHWTAEEESHYSILGCHGGEAFAENMDQFRINWFIKLFEKYAPYQKKIFVDDKDIDLFYQIYRNCPGKKIVAVVNQWHMAGIENHWRHSTNTLIDKPPINPIGDMDLDIYMENQLVNDKLREFTSKITKSEPATWQNYITHYHKDVQEPERTRHIEFLDCNDPEMFHGLPYEYKHNDQKQKSQESAPPTQNKSDVSQQNVLLNKKVDPAPVEKKIHQQTPEKQSTPKQEIPKKPKK